MLQLNSYEYDLLQNDKQHLMISNIKQTQIKKKIQKRQYQKTIFIFLKMSQQPYNDPYRVNPNPVNTTSTLNQPIKLTETTGINYPPGTYVQPVTTLNQPETLSSQQTGHGLLHRKPHKQHKQGERSSSSSSGSEQKRRKYQQSINEPQKQGYMAKRKQKAGNLMHKSDKQKGIQ